jgi:hypothetical protein
MITLAPELADANPGLEHILSNLDLIGASWRQIVRDDFAYFRQHIRPGMLWGFWNEVVAIELTEFYKDFVAGKRPKIVICTPPQHGKSWTAVDFIGWVSGRDPNLKTIFASFSDELGMRTNKELQRMLDNDRYRMLFPKTKLAKRGETWQRNASILEFAGHSGSFRNVTVEGAINGIETLQFLEQRLATAAQRLGGVVPELVLLGDGRIGHDLDIGLVLLITPDQVVDVPARSDHHQRRVLGEARHPVVGVSAPAAAAAVVIHSDITRFSSPLNA